MKVTEKDVLDARETASFLNLKGNEILSHFPPGRIIKICNGIGPEWFPETLRQMVDALHPSLKIPAMIHDLQYYNGSGKTEDFEQANAYFKENGITMAKYLYGWYDPRRYIAIYEARKFSSYCDIFGKPAYEAAMKERAVFIQSIYSQESKTLKNVIKSLEDTKKIINNMGVETNDSIESSNEQSNNNNKTQKEGESNGVQESKCKTGKIKSATIQKESDGKEVFKSKCEKVENKKREKEIVKKTSEKSNQEVNEGIEKCSEKTKGKKQLRTKKIVSKSRLKLEGPSSVQEKRFLKPSPSSSRSFKSCARQETKMGSAK